MKKILVILFVFMLSACSSATSSKQTVCSYAIDESSAMVEKINYDSDNNITSIDYEETYTLEELGITDDNKEESMQQLKEYFEYLAEYYGEGYSYSVSEDGDSIVLKSSFDMSKADISTLIEDGYLFEEDLSVSGYVEEMEAIGYSCE